jgi:hypothetical protein
MQPASDANLAKHLKVLEQVQLGDSLDYETIGKITVASILHQYEREIHSQKPNREGHVLLKSNLRHSIALHVQPFTKICCICTIEGENVIVCRGDCCQTIMAP